MIETYATSDTCPDCEAVVYDVGRYELRFCPLHAAAPEMLEALEFGVMTMDQTSPGVYSVLRSADGLLNYCPNCPPCQSHLPSEP